MVSVEDEAQLLSTPVDAVLLLQVSYAVTESTGRVLVAVVVDAAGGGGCSELDDNLIRFDTGGTIEID